MFSNQSKFLPTIQKSILNVTEVIHNGKIQIPERIQSLFYSFFNFLMLKNPKTEKTHSTSVQQLLTGRVLGSS